MVVRSHEARKAFEDLAKLLQLPIVEDTDLLLRVSQHYALEQRAKREREREREEEEKGETERERDREKGERWVVSECAGYCGVVSHIHERTHTHPLFPQAIFKRISRKFSPEAIATARDALGEVRVSP